LLYANDILEKEKKNMPLLKFLVRLHRWVEHVKTGIQSEKKFQARVVTSKKQENVNSKLNDIIDELLINIENSKLHESVVIIKYITKFKMGYGGFRIPTGSSYIDLPLWTEKKHV